MASRTRSSPTRLRHIEELKAGLGEASAIVVVGPRRFIVADDEAGLRLVDASGARPRVTLLVDAGDDDRVAGIEGLCVVDQRVYAVRERDGAVVSFAAPSATPTRPALEAHGRLPRPDGGGKKNKGFEGLAFLPAGLAFDGRAHLLAVHEGKPRAVSVFSWPGLDEEAHHVIDGALDGLLPDLSDIAVHPKTGALWILSDEGEGIAVVELHAGGLRLVCSHAVPVDDGEKPEGLAFDDDGGLWLVTDDSGRLLRLAP